MSNRIARLRSRALERDVARLADGTLVGPRRELLGRMLAGSPELERRLDEQRRALAAVRSSGTRERAPLALRIRHRTLKTGQTPRPFSRQRLGAGLAGALAALAAILVLVGGGQAGPTVALAATIAARPATATVAEPPDDSVALPRLRAAGLPFPYWEDHFGWRATGARTDRIDGRAMTTVFYRRGAEQIAYTIVSGRSLAAIASTRAPTGATTRPPAGLATFSTAGGRLVVTWLRRGHTCVLSGSSVSLHALVELASWRGHGGLPY
jgi:hypothetical protein